MNTYFVWLEENKKIPKNDDLSERIKKDFLLLYV